MLPSQHLSALAHDRSIELANEIHDELETHFTDRQQYHYVHIL